MSHELLSDFWGSADELTNISPTQTCVYRCYFALQSTEPIKIIKRFSRIINHRCLCIIRNVSLRLGKNMSCECAEGVIWMTGENEQLSLSWNLQLVRFRLTSWLWFIWVYSSAGEQACRDTHQSEWGFRWPITLCPVRLDCAPFFVCLFVFTWVHQRCHTYWRISAETLIYR